MREAAGSEKDGLQRYISTSSHLENVSLNTCRHKRINTTPPSPCHSFSRGGGPGGV